jgi:hypothetical protein
MNCSSDPAVLGPQLMGPERPIWKPQGRDHSAWNEMVFAGEEDFGMKTSMDFRLPGQPWVVAMRVLRAVMVSGENFIVTVGKILVLKIK